MKHGCCLAVFLAQSVRLPLWCEIFARASLQGGRGQPQNKDIYLSFSATLSSVLLEDGKDWSQKQGKCIIFDPKYQSTPELFIHQPTKTVPTHFYCQPRQTKSGNILCCHFSIILKVRWACHNSLSALVNCKLDLHDFRIITVQLMTHTRIFSHQLLKYYQTNKVVR